MFQTPRSVYNVGVTHCSQSSTRTAYSQGLTFTCPAGSGLLYCTQCISDSELKVIKIMVKKDTQNNHYSEPSGLGRARLALAISAGKLAGVSGRLLRIGGGTSLPGMIARRIDPNVLKSVIGVSKAKKIVITGSNGKTTTARMTATIADYSGQRVSHNRTG